MEKFLGYVLAIAALGGVVVGSFWAPVASAESSLLTCLEMQKQATGGGFELQKKANDFCKISDAQTAALHKSVK